MTGVLCRFDGEMTRQGLDVLGIKRQGFALHKNVGKPVYPAEFDTLPAKKKPAPRKAGRSLEDKYIHDDPYIPDPKNAGTSRNARDM